MTLGQHLFLRPGCRQPHDGCAAGEMRTEHLHRATVEFGERLAFKGAGTFKRTMRGAIPGLARGDTRARVGVWWDSRPNGARQEWSREPGESSSCSHKRGSPGRAVAFARGQPSCPVCIYIYMPTTDNKSLQQKPTLSNQRIRRGTS